MSILKKSTTDVATKAVANSNVQTLITPYNMSTQSLQIYSNATFAVSAALTVASFAVSGVGIYRQHQKNKMLKAQLEASSENQESATEEPED
jgi:hypothetical protein